MKMSTRGRYATRIMVQLALHDGDSRPARKQHLAAEEGISADYVEQILMKLKTSGLVQSFRGAKGGFALAREADNITVEDVIKATEGPINLVPCEEENCERASMCVTRPIWAEAADALRRVLAEKTIGELAREAQELDVSAATVYEI